MLSSKATNRLPLALASLPAVYLLYLIVSYWVDVPYRDQWRIARFMIHSRENGLSLSELFSQHNDSRKFFPRLIFYALSMLGHWDVRREMLVIFLLACGCSVLLNDLTKRTLPLPEKARWAWVLGLNLFIFGPAQYQNWLWGIQLVCLIPIFFLLLGLRIQNGLGSPSAKALLCAGCCLIATFSYANGLILWPLLGISLCFQEVGKKNLQSLALFTALAIGTCWLFFHGYYNQQSNVRTETIDFVIYFLSWCGASLFPQSVSTSLPLGGVLVATWAWFVAAVLRNKAVDKKKALPWILLGLYAVAAGIACAKGRTNEGLVTSLKSKYVTFSLYLPVSLAALFLLTSMKELAKRRRWLDSAWAPALTFLGAAVTIYGINFESAMRQMALTQAERLNGREAIREIWQQNPSPRPAQLGRSDSEIKELTFPLVRLGLLKTE